MFANCDCRRAGPNRSFNLGFHGPQGCLRPPSNSCQLAIRRGLNQEIDHIVIDDDWCSYRGAASTPFVPFEKPVVDQDAAGDAFDSGGGHLIGQRV